MMKRILVPSDMSEIAENGLKLAVDIAGKTGADIYLVNFLDHPMGRTFSKTHVAGTGQSEEGDMFTIQLVRKNFNDLKRIASAYASNNVEIHYEVFDEDFDDGLEMYVKEKDIDLVVMGTSGEETIEEYFSGNHAEQAIASLGCPVISMKNDYKSSPINDIILGVELDEDPGDVNEYNKATAYINDFTTSLGIEVDLVHVADLNSGKKPELEQQLKTFAQSHGFQNYTATVIENDDKEDGLLAFAYAKRASMIAVFTHAQGGFFRIFSQSLSEEISKEADIPVLTINIRNI